MNNLAESSNLNGKCLAAYSIIYKLNYQNSVAKLTDITEKSLLRPHAFESFLQQQNLVFIDFIFPNILADIALEALFRPNLCFSDYIQLPKTFTLVDKASDQYFISSRFSKFVLYLIFSDIAEIKASSGEIQPYQFSVEYDNTLHFFTSETINDLIDRLLDAIHVRINYDKSYLVSDEVVLNLEIYA